MLGFGYRHIERLVVSTGLLLAVCCGTVDASVIGYWRFEEGSGTSFNDSSGLGNHGTFHNGASFSTDVPVNPVPRNGLGNQYSAAFDGVDDYGRVAHNASFDITSQITLEAWIKMDADSVNNYAIVARQYGTDTKDSFILGVRRGVVNGPQNLLFGLGDASGGQHYIDSAFSPVLGQWYHVAGTWDGSTMKTFINGVQIDSLAFSGTIGYAVDEDVYIGVNDEGTPNLGAFWDGNIDEVRISDVALNPDQFLNSPVPEPATIAVWSVLGLCGVGYGLRRKMRKTS